MALEPQQLKAFLLDAGLITESRFNQAFKKAQKENKKIEEVLISEKLIDQENFDKLRAYILGIPYISLEEEIINPDVLKIIPEPLARKHNIVAFKKTGQELQVAMLDPDDLKTIDFIKKKADLRISPCLTNKKSIENALSQYQEKFQIGFGKFLKKEGEEIRTILPSEKLEEKTELEKKAQEVSIVSIIDTILNQAVLEKASDIHIEPMEKEILIRYRIDGILRDVMVLPIVLKSGIVARIKVLTNLKLDEQRLPQDGRFKIETESYKYSCRVSILPVHYGEKIVIRLLSETAKPFNLEELGLRNLALEKMQKALKKPVGMILVTGPTGCGKTTTLYSAMAILNKPGVNISTVEDPIEYCMPKINQTQVNAQIGLTFANGLRALLRQDPNILMVGEIRDKETASLAINAALTGHLVLSTLHTNSAAGAIPRLLDMKIEPFLLSSTLNLILAQRLVRKLADEKQEYKLKKEELENLSRYCDLKKIEEILRKEKFLAEKQNFSDLKFYRPQPSKKAPEGYKGRIGIYEVLEVSESIRELIQKRVSADEIQKKAQEEGMKLMLEDGFIKAAMGITSIEEILRVTIE